MNCSICGRPLRNGIARCDSCGSWLLGTDAPTVVGAPRVQQAERVGPERVGPERVGPERVGPERIGPERVGPERVAQSTARGFTEFRYDAGPSTSTTYWPPPRTEDRTFIPAPQFEFAPVDEDDFDFEATRISHRRMGTRFWTLDLPDGTCEVVVGSMIVGRAASPRPDWPSARLLTVPKASLSVSKSHAVFAESSGSIIVRDLRSRNGVIVTRGDGTELDLGVGGSVVVDDSCSVELGDLLIRVRRH